MCSDSIKVSVIVPVYNTGSSIRKCLDSLMNQTISGWEIVLVDDGSTDSSGAICDEYAKKYETISKDDGQVRVVHRKNGGVSAARQNGLDAAKGEYVIHADPDDWIEPTMLKDLYDLAKDEDADMVICDLISEIDGKHYYKSQKPTSLNHKDVLNDLFGQIHGSCCNKLIKKECISRYDAHFPIGINYCEDLCFNVQLLKHDIKVAYLPKAYYHYVQSSTSITNNYTRKTFENHIRFVNFLATILPSDSTLLHKSKLSVKKLAFRNSLLRDKEFVKLYPEILSTNDTNPLLKWMYNFAFNGNLVMAKVLLKGYNFFHKLAFINTIQ